MVGEEKRRREEEEKRKREKEEEIQVWKLILVSLELELWFGISLLVWNSCLDFWNLFVWFCWLGNPPSSFFAYVWGLKNPISV